MQIDNQIKARTGNADKRWTRRAEYIWRVLKMLFDFLVTEGASLTIRLSKFRGPGTLLAC